MSAAAAATTAVSEFQAAIAMLPSEHPARPKYLSNLSAALKACFGVGGPEALLDEAVAASREAVRLTPPDEPRRLGRIANLVGVLTDRFRVGHGTDGLDEAIRIGRAAVAEPTADEARRASLAGNLAWALLTRSEATTADLAELAEAADLFRAALAGTPGHDPHRQLWQAGLRECAVCRYASSGQPADRDAAIGSIRDYVNAEMDGPDLTVHLGTLLHLLRARVGESPARAIWRRRSRSAVGSWPVTASPARSGSKPWSISVSSCAAGSMALAQPRISTRRSRSAGRRSPWRTRWQTPRSGLSCRVC